MHIFVSFPVDEEVSDELILSNVRKGLGSLGKDCDLLSFPKIESDSIDCLFDSEERILTIENLLEDIIRKYNTTYHALTQKVLVDTDVLGRGFDHFLKSFSWDSIKYPLTLKMPELLSIIENEIMEAIEALKEKEKTYTDEKKHRAETASIVCRMYDADIDEIEHMTVDDEACGPFFKRYYIGVYDKLRDKDIETLSSINGLFIESGKMVKKCDDGEIYQSLGRNDCEEDIIKSLEEHGFIAAQPKYTKEEYLRQKEEEKESAAHLMETECEYERLILGRLPSLYTLLLHVKHLGLYIESVLRYGLPATFCFFTLESKHGNKVIHKWKKLAASWKYSNRIAAVEKTTISEDNAALHDFVYKMIGDFNLEEVKE
ncbi:V-type H+-transporting ATPase subunit C [Nematocida sp. ERTm5]|nr:V-type H+-transporting ATPase subunit C [Nematocida sp. ERTm5]